MEIGHVQKRDAAPPGEFPATDAAYAWQHEALRLRPLQPYEDFYKAVRAFEAGVEWARNNPPKVEL